MPPNNISTAIPFRFVILSVAKDLSFETADRYSDQVAAAGGLAAWMAQLDADPQRWAERLDVARVEVAAAVPYVE